MSGFEDHAPSVANIPAEGLSRVSLLAQQLTALGAEQQTLEERLKETKEHIRRIQEDSLPGAMLELGMEAIKLQDGTQVTVGTDYYADIPKNRTAEAFAWLRDHGYDSMIKNEIKALFGKGEDQLAAMMIRFATENGIDIKSKQAVHPQTLRAFVREKEEEGAPVPHDVFGVFVKRVAKITNRS